MRRDSTFQFFVFSINFTFLSDFIDFYLNIVFRFDMLVYMFLYTFSSSYDFVISISQSYTFC